MSIVLMLSGALFMVPNVAATPPAPEETGCKEFTAYGFNYVRIRNVHTDKRLYIIADHVVPHCCGDQAQLAKLTLSGNDIARDYIGYEMDANLGDYNLQPVFSKCLTSEEEAERIRTKKIEFFQRLGHSVVEVPMKIHAAGICTE